jgi:hypothetical protein
VISFVLNPTAVLLFECFVLLKADIKLYLLTPRNASTIFLYVAVPEFVIAKQQCLTVLYRLVFLSHWQIHDDGPNGRVQVIQSLLLVMAGLPRIPSQGANPISNQPNTELNVLASLEANGASENSIKEKSKRFRYLKKLADLRKPDEVKNAIALLKVSNGTKRNLCNLYQKYVDYYKLQWTKPKYKHQRKLVKIPTREKLEMLIAHSGRKLATKLQISFETGLRPIEVVSLTPQEIDFDHKLILPRTAKNGAPRALKFSLKLEAMLKEHIQREETKPAERLFKTKPRTYA